MASKSKAAASTITLDLVDRNPKQPVRKLPKRIELPGDTTVEQAKIAIARQCGVKDHNRIGLFFPDGRKTLKDKAALVKDHESVMSAGKLLVKDLGPQVSWRTVMCFEYLGPILFHALVVKVRPYIYRIPPFVYKSEAETPMTKVQWLIFGLFQLHFVKRELESMFLHKFSANTMPAWNIIRNSAFYWLSAGLLSSLHVYAPNSISARDELVPLDYASLAIFTVGELCNFIVHKHLASLRAPGGTEKGIPNCIGSSLVTSPNYMFEVISWIGVILICRSITVVGFILGGIYYMRLWSRGKEAALRQYFGDKYKKKRYTMLPGLI